METNEKQVLDYLRSILKSGATIKATDVTKPVLEFSADGFCIGGLTITAGSVEDADFKCGDYSEFWSNPLYREKL